MTTKTNKNSTKKAVETKEVNNALNFDFLNSFNLEKFAKNETARQGAKEIYKISSDLSEDERKTKRRKLKRERNNIIKNMLHCANIFKVKKSKENETNFFDSVKLFKDFYFKNYLLNDFSIDSICSTNSKDRDTLQIALEIAKNVK